MKYILNLFIISLLALVFSSCEFYRKHEGVKQLQWAKQDVKTYEVAISDTDTKYDIYVALRHTPGIEQDDIKVKLITKTPSNEGSEKAYNLPIRDKETGKLYGEAAHEICDTETVVESGYQFKEAGNYTFQIQHNEQVKGDVLLNVMEIGLVIKESGK